MCEATAGPESKHAPAPVITAGDNTAGPERKHAPAPVITTGVMVDFKRCITHWFTKATKGGGCHKPDAYKSEGAFGLTTSCISGQMDIIPT